MKIAWFTPFDKKSAIGRYSQSILDAMRGQVDVDLWITTTDNSLDTDVPVIAYGEAANVSSGDLSRSDLVIYNFGNYVPFHREIFEVSQRVPGLAILHDFVMHHFFASLFLEVKQDAPGYKALLERHYGPEEAARATCRAGGPPLWETDGVVDFPLFEEVITNAYGVVTHSHFLQRKVAAVFPGPSKAISLPYDHQMHGSAAASTRAAIDVPEEAVLLLTVGHGNTNKRVHAILEALADLPDLSGRFIYAILGPYTDGYRERLQGIIDRGGLASSVRMTGYTPDDVLQSYLAQADVCLNLRYPAFEGASGSLAEAMLNGKPVVVTRTGSYEELPEEAVLKIDPDDEPAQLRAALRRLILQPELREQYAARARAHADEYFRAKYFVRELLGFADEVRAAKPIMQLMDQTGELLQSMSVTPEMPIAAEVSRLMSELF